MSTPRPVNWLYVRRQAGTLLYLMLAIYAVVHIGLDLVEDDANWVSEWLAIIGAPVWWWTVIRRITEDVLTEKIAEQDKRKVRTP